MTFIEPGGRRSVLGAGGLPAPLHVVPSFLGLRFLSAWDKITLFPALIALLTQRPRDRGQSFEEWLKGRHQTRNAIERFWKPILVSALSEHLDRITVPYAAQVIRESMKSKNARAMGIPTVPLSELYRPAEEYMTDRGGTIRLRTSVQEFLPKATSILIRVEDREEEFDYAILAMPFDSLSKLLPSTMEAKPLHIKICRFENSPITGIHLWFDRKITRLPHAVLLDRTIQWMFHKSMLLDSHNLRDQRRQNEAPDNTPESPTDLLSPSSQDLDPPGSRGSSPSEELSPHRQGSRLPSYIELVISSSKSLVASSRQNIIDLALSELLEFFPRAHDAKLLKATVVKEVNATFSPQPGIDDYRPEALTAWPRVFLAGDWTATGWPATMEGAVRSGYLAAEALTRQAGREKSFLVSDLAAEGIMRWLAGN
ncbi:MAG: FAD-dependent oxidoreductase [Acidobacteria bacterium]|nr:FAD-dependent oxidoreductase [Acidobacteriota bacterium]